MTDIVGVGGKARKELEKFRPELFFRDIERPIDMK
jgi:hypothetical protein